MYNNVQEVYLRQGTRLPEWFPRPVWEFNVNSKCSPDIEQHQFALSIHFSRYVSVCELALSPETAISNNLDSILFPHNCQLSSALPLGCSLTIPIISNNSRYSSLLFGYEQETDMNRCTARWQSSCFIAVSFPEVKSRHADLDGKQSRYIDQFLHHQSRIPQKLAQIKLWCVSLLSPRIP